MRACCGFDVSQLKRSCSAVKTAPGKRVTVANFCQRRNRKRGLTRCWLCAAGWHIAHTALRTDMHLVAEALRALRRTLHSGKPLLPWQVGQLP